MGLQTDDLMVYKCNLCSQIPLSLAETSSSLSHSPCSSLFLACKEPDGLEALRLIPEWVWVFLGLGTQGLQRAEPAWEAAL